MNKKIIIPTSIGIALIIVGIIAIYYQELEILKNDEPIKIELDGDVQDIPEIQDKLDEIKKNADENIYEPDPREWQTSGPFQIDRSEYLLGEKIFIVIGGLDLDEKGQIVFLRPSNGTHYTVWQTVPFDGTKKSQFNYYIQPGLSEQQQICTVDDIIGEWTVVFRGTNHPNLKFEVINKIIPGDEESYVPVC